MKIIPRKYIKMEPLNPKNLNIFPINNETKPMNRINDNIIFNNNNFIFNLFL